jgi:hypothetical protein
MKNLIYILILSVTNIQFVVAEPTCIGRGELIFYNLYADGVTVKVIPVGSIFSGHTNSFTGHEQKYSFRPCKRTTDSGTNWVHVVGGSRTMPLMSGWPLDCHNPGYAVFDWDEGSNYEGIAYGHPEVCAGAVSYGLWRVEFWYSPSEEESQTLINYCWLDYRDWRAPLGCELGNDLFVKLTSDNNIYFFWSSAPQESEPEAWIPITNQYVPDRTIQWFRQVKTEQGEIKQCPGVQNRGNFLTSSTDGGYWLNWPIDAHELNSNYEHITPGLLNMNLSVVSGHHAYIKPVETMYIESGAGLNLLAGGILTFMNNSTLYVKRGGIFCNYGGVVNGNVNIIYERSGLYVHCPYLYDGFIIGGNMTIEDSAIVEFPDSTVITFDSTSQLVMKPHSEIRLGRYSKLIFQNGSKITCENAKFTSLDSTQTWDGIYLEDNAFDTLKNCIFENAYNGINITQPLSVGLTQYSTEITNCSFRNTTNTQLLNQIYVNSSDGILIKGNTTLPGSSAGFLAGVIMEYCPANGVIVTDNILNYVTNGITAIQTSTYIARNVITGPVGSGIGIYLDNSNGTLEYNRVYNFETSLGCYYSSPYILKNTLTGATETNLGLKSNSVLY